MSRRVSIHCPFDSCSKYLKWLGALNVRMSPLGYSVTLKSRIMSIYHLWKLRCVARFSIYRSCAAQINHFQRPLRIPGNYPMTERTLQTSAVSGGVQEPATASISTVFSEDDATLCTNDCGVEDAFARDPLVSAYHLVSGSCHRLSCASSILSAYFGC